MRVLLILLGVVALDILATLLVLGWARRAARAEPDDMMAVAEAAGVVPGAGWVRWPAAEYPLVGLGVAQTRNGGVTLGGIAVHRACVTARRDGRLLDVCTACQPRLGIPRRQVTS